ncbi:hypothetical protein CCR75_002100 [Bremia lactucae]|uniref:Transglutaminase elicitor n=1 Tax=Bremia lactucae TaxID=4779 RepID=A0A976FNL6_BRELC|nr:hypothetical protein CCR75_002099 [Bremia lactucae]TDH69906.1 hypothetical protein CCR75_002100 [Bremia lactucae]
MVYSPRFSLISAAVAVASLKMQQASAGSMYYGAHTVSDATNSIGPNFPGRGGEVDEKYTAVEVTIDSTLPVLANIPSVPILYPELLSNVTAPPKEPVSNVVGNPVVVEKPPSTEKTPDEYVFTGSPPVVLGEHASRDCATGWENPLAYPPKHEKSGLTQSRGVSQDRRLNTYSNRDILSLEWYLQRKLELNWKNLPTEGVMVKAPWPGPYWPDFQDSINVEWARGQPSAAAKYAMAFNYDVPQFTDGISRVHGIKSEGFTKQCTRNSDCLSISNRTFCGVPKMETSGWCIASWLGICHAWAAAAIAEPEPNCPVTHNGVEFRALDIKGLLSILYADTAVGTVFTGVRFKHGTNSTDTYGRGVDPIFRDLNPGFFHLAMTNVLGIDKKSFIVDVSADLEVWNQPVRGYKVYEQTEMSLQEAAQTFYGLKEYPWNVEAKSIVFVTARLSWVDSTYDDGNLVDTGIVDRFTKGEWYYYLLEIDASGLIIGGEWLFASNVKHPDFLWLVASKPAPNAVTRTGISYKEVSMLLQKSVECSG